MTLRKIVEEFRCGILDGRPSDRMCYMVAWPLQGYLSMLGHECELVEGEVNGRQHYWLALADGRIIDATADQFPKPNGRKMPPVYIGRQPRRYHATPSLKLAPGRRP